ncbi:MAG: hypothetical protein ABSH16_09815 [Sedimentisphaerales bacterium]
MDQNSLEKLKMMVSSAIEFKKNEGISVLSEELKKKLARMEGNLSLLQKLGQERLSLQKKLATCVSSAYELKEEIFTALNTPSEASSLRDLEKSRDFYKAQLEAGISDPEFKAIIEESLRLAEKGIRDFPKIDQLLREGRAMIPLMDLAASVYVLWCYSVVCAKMSLFHPKQSLIGKLHILMLRYRLTSVIKEEKDLYQYNKILWALKAISTLINLIPTKIEMLASMLILKSKLHHCIIESEEDIKSLIDLGSDVDKILEDENISISVLKGIVNILESILKKGKQT